MTACQSHGRTAWASSFVRIHHSRVSPTAQKPRAASRYPRSSRLRRCTLTISFTLRPRPPVAPHSSRVMPQAAPRSQARPMTNLPVMKRLAAAGLVVASIFVVAACSNDDKPTAAEANATICKEKADLAATVNSVKSLDPSSASVDGLKTVRENVSHAVDELNAA